MGDQHVYREHNYDLGNQVLILRTRIALTQIALASQLGVHRRSVQKWETGLSYPKAEMLQRLIAVFLRHHAFTPGNERAEALALWEQAARDGPHPLPAFDEVWFARTLSLQSASPVAPVQRADHEREQLSGATPTDATRPAPSHTIIDWGEAIAVPTLYGRARELATLQQWLVDDRCRVIAILGLGGIGKSSLAITLAHQALPEVEVVLFRSLQNGPPVAELLDQTIRAISGQQATPPDQVFGKIALLIQLLRQRRCLLILDNYEAIMQPSVVTGAYRSGYAAYGELLGALSEREHQSCLLLTSREKPAELGRLEGHRRPVRSLQLAGLADTACRLILEARDITATATELSALARLYDGNPLALSLVSEPIRELFGGDVSAFLAMGDAFFNGVGQLLAQQFGRSTPLEQAILTWLAIERELVPLSTMLADLGEAVPQRQVLVALESLRRRLLIERGPDRPTFTLQPVILEYVTDQLVEAVEQEIVNGQVALLCSHALIKAQAKDYVRRSQEQLIGQSLLEQLRALGGADGAQERLLGLLEGWRGQAERAQGYGPGNVVNLLRLLRGDLRGLDFSRLAVRQAYLAQVDAQDARLVEAHLAETVLAEAFDFPSSVAVSGDGALLAAGTSTGQVWLWRVADRTPLWAVQAHTGGVRGMALSADGQLVASGGADGTLRLWEAGTQRPLATLEGHIGGVWGVALSADGQLVASGGAEGTVRLWEVGSGRLLATLSGHIGGVWGVALSADGQLVVSGSFDGTVKLWEASSGAILGTLRPERRYERMDITGLTGVTEAQRAALLALGAA